MNTKTIEILPNRLMTTDEVAKAVRKDHRTVQQLGKAQVIKSTKEAMPRGGSRRMYDPQSVQDYLQNPGKLHPKTTTQPAANANGQALVRSRSAASQNERALDTVSIVGQMLAAQKSQLETVVSLILNAQKAEADANRERLKAEREDARERWELERKEARERWDVMRRAEQLAG
jgi:hypothetical protein